MKAIDFKFDKASKGQSGKEDELQEAVANFLDLNNEDWFHPPNGGLRNKIVASKLKRQGVKSGIPDVILLSRKTVVELKVGYNKPSLKQLYWLDQFQKQGFKAYWVNSLDEFINLYNSLKNEQ